MIPARVETLTIDGKTVVVVTEIGTKVTHHFELDALATGLHMASAALAAARLIREQAE